MDIKTMKERILNSKPSKIEPLTNVIKDKDREGDDGKFKIEIKSTTKLSDIFEKYPYLTERFIRIDKKLEKVLSPMFRLILPTASIFTICEKTGVSVSTLVDGIKKLIEEEESKNLC